MATSITIIYNRALNLIGQPHILAPSEDSKAARTCNLVWNAIRDEVLRVFPWRCVTKRAALAMLEAVPYFGFAHYFQLPTDFIRMVSMEDPDDIYEIEGDRLLYDGTTAKIKYIYRETDANKYDSILCTVLAVRLAAELGNPIAGSQALADSMMQKYMAFIGLGASIDSTESSMKQLTAEDWISEHQ
jgi:hypothetical protein